MPTKLKLLGGRKINSRHTTVIPDAEKLISLIKELPEVGKIAIGRIEPRGAAQRRIKIKPLSACLEIKVYGTDGIQYFYVYTSNSGSTVQSINRFWEN